MSFWNLSRQSSCSGIIGVPLCPSLDFSYPKVRLARGPDRCRNAMTKNHLFVSPQAINPVASRFVREQQRFRLHTSALIDAMIGTIRFPTGAFARSDNVTSPAHGREIFRAFLI